MHRALNHESNLKRTEEIFCAAMEKNQVQERQALLDQECGTDHELRSAVEQMLAAQSEVEKTFEETRKALLSPEELARTLVSDLEVRAVFGCGLDPEEKVGIRIGRYKLVQVIGKGGWGVVYLAEQEEPVRRQVALKVIRFGMDIEGVIARFESERQALAMMEHPNIARVLDAGATELGRPYFVMELVRGARITDYCDENRLNLSERLHLFLQVCHAIQHAHQKGIIHRDIKPSNILITSHDDQASPKVIDFGIAKSMEEPLTDRPLQTIVSHIIGTPAYMSPEQAESGGLDVDTRSDIYSLGTLLCELLTSETPFTGKELVEAGPSEMRRKLREIDPSLPSAKLASMPDERASAVTRSRSTTADDLKDALRDDLDWIVMKALEKDRNRRYQTPRDLALDIQRHLDHEEVQARPPSRAYRLQKLVRRNKSVFIAGMLICLTLAAGFGVSAWMYLREKEARREAEQLQVTESRLRRQAEIREKITRATVLLSHDDMAAADDLVSDIPENLCPAYMEAVRVFRTVADWDVENERWPEAARRALMVVRLDRVDASDQGGGISCDYMIASTTLLQIGDVEAYRKLCREGQQRFATTTSSVAAEQILKVCLLLPATTETLHALKPIATTAAASLPEPYPSNPTTVDAWRLTSLALYEYRLGNWEKTERATRSAVTNTDCPPRTALADLILAMCLHHQDRNHEAITARDDAKRLIEARFEHPLAATAMDTWFSWIMDRLLLQEASALLSEKSVIPD